MENTKSLTGTLREKVIEEIERYTLREMAGYLLLWFIGGVLSAAVVNADAMTQHALSLLRWHDLAVVKVVVVLTLVSNSQRIISFLRDWFARDEEASEEDTLEGIPVTELLDHLFTVKSLKVKDVTAKFQIPQYRVEELTKNLKRVSVLVPGPNNASMLNPDYSRQDIASIIKGVPSAKELRPLFRRNDHGLTSEPSANQIKSRVEEATTPLLRSPGFATRNMAMAS